MSWLLRLSRFDLLMRERLRLDLVCWFLRGGYWGRGGCDLSWVVGKWELGANLKLELGSGFCNLAV